MSKSDEKRKRAGERAEMWEQERLRYDERRASIAERIEGDLQFRSLASVLSDIVLGETQQWTDGA